MQISQLPCSDLSARFASNGGGTIDPTIGPKRSPLGLAGDPGGMPLYKNNTLVGAIGVLADGTYTVDRDVRDYDRDDDELVAVAGSVGFEAPATIRANRIAVDGRSLRFADVDSRNLVTGATDAAAVNLAAAGAFATVNGYFTAGASIDGQAFGFTTSGILPDPDGFYPDPTGAHPGHRRRRQPLPADRSRRCRRRLADPGRGHRDHERGAERGAHRPGTDPAGRSTAMSR